MIWTEIVVNRPIGPTVTCPTDCARFLPPWTYRKYIMDQNCVMPIGGEKIMPSSKGSGQSFNRTEPIGEINGAANHSWTLAGT